jgi:hypothetical protein
MSGTVRAGLVFGLGAALAFLGSTMLPIPCLNIISVIALGWGAGYTAAKTTGAGPGQGTGRGLTAGAIAGVIVLLGTAIGFLVLTNTPAFQQQLQAQLAQNPAFGESGIDPSTFGSALGVGIGLFCGFINFVLMLIAGAIGGLMWKGTPAAANYVPAGGSAVPNQTYSSTDQPYGTPNQPYRDPGEPGGARVYDPNDPNRPQ